MEEFETDFAQQAPPPSTEDPTLFELPPLIIDGTQKPVEKKPQALWRALIPTEDPTVFELPPLIFDGTQTPVENKSQTQLRALIPTEDPTVFELPPLNIGGTQTPVETKPQAQLPAFTPKDGPTLFELPPLTFDGIPTPLANMPQAQMRAFIPMMLKCSTGRGKPGWGDESRRPPWWPNEVPWANVRLDTRTAEEKKKIDWTQALRQVIENCYKYHGREDLISLTLADEDDILRQTINTSKRSRKPTNNDLTQTVLSKPKKHPTLFKLPPLIIDGIPTPVEKMLLNQMRVFIPLIVKCSTGRRAEWGKESKRPPWWPNEIPWANVRTDTRTEEEKKKMGWTQALHQIIINCYKYHGREDLLSSNDESVPTASKRARIPTNNDCTQTVLSKVKNADGSVSLIQVDPNNPIVKLPDGSTAKVDGVATLHRGKGGITIQTVQSLSDDDQGDPVPVSNIITLPVSTSMYQSMLANIQQLRQHSVHNSNAGRFKQFK